jgi:hypothetical protein
MTDNDDINDGTAQDGAEGTGGEARGQQQEGAAGDGNDANGPEKAPGTDPRLERMAAATAERLLLSSLFGGAERARPSGIHEMGVQGSVIEQSFRFADEYMRPELEFVVVDGASEAIPVVIGKDGLDVLPRNSFDSWLDAPRFRAGTAKLTSLDSFIAHVNRYRSDNTVVFANDDRASPSLMAVLDYHGAGSETAAAFGRHRSSFAFPLSDEWKAWSGKNAKPMSMTDFAAFLEDHIIDVLNPQGVTLNDEAASFVDALGGEAFIANPGRLMDIATSLQVNEASVVAEAVTLASGEGQISFQSEHRDATGNKLSVPRLFILGIPVFRNGERYQVLARLRYRKTPQGLVFFFELWRLDLVFDHAFTQAVEKVQIETGAPVYLGAPESSATVTAL